MTALDRFQLRKTSEGYEVEWSGIATMRVGSQCSFRPLPGADAAVVDKIRRGPAAGVERYLLRRGMAFHASAVSIAGRSLLLAGESGVGKSTTAALLVQRGAR